MPAYTLTNMYFATGEGMTRWVMYMYAENEAKVLEEYKRRVGDYFALGAEISGGFDFSSAEAKLLLTPKVQELLVAKDYGNAVFFAELHINYS